MDEDKKIQDISFEGEGCAISMASASIMTDLMKGKSEKEVKEIVSKFLDMIKEKDDINTNLIKDDEKTKLMSLGGVKNYPMRVKCATLSWHALTSALEDFVQSRNEVSTTSKLACSAAPRRFRGAVGEAASCRSSQEERRTRSLRRPS